MSILSIAIGKKVLSNSDKPCRSKVDLDPQFLELDVNLPVLVILKTGNSKSQKFVPRQLHNIKQNVSIKAEAYLPAIVAKMLIRADLLR